MMNNKFLKIFSELRTLQNTYTSNVSKDDLLLLECFILLLRKENIINSKMYDASQLSNAQNFRFLFDDSKDLEIKQLFYNHILQIIERTRALYLAEIVSIYNRVDDILIKQDANILFEYLLSSRFNHKGIGSDVLQPKELTKVINHFMPTGSDFTYYNPFAGLGSLAIGLPENVSYVGEEISHYTYALGKMRLLINSRNKNFDFLAKDSIKSFYEINQYDFIAFNPPFNLKINENLYGGFIRDNKYYLKNNANALIVSEFFEKLKDDGKMAFLMPNSFLFSRNSKSKSLKKYLVNNGYINTIISLPTNVLQFSSISVNIIVLQKIKSKNSKVRFVDASELISSKQKRLNILDADKVINLLNGKEYSQFVKEISATEIAENDYDLSVNRFVLEDLNISEDEAKNLVKFKELISMIKPVKASETHGIYIKIGDLANDNISYTKSFVDVEVRELRRDANLLTQDTLLLSLAYNSLKPTLYQKKSEKVYYPTTNILGCIINTEIVNPDYLVLELHKEYVKSQINSKKLGTAVQRILKVDFLNLKIVVPSKEEQLNKVLEYRTAIINDRQAEFKLLAKSFNLDIADENSFLRHQIAGTLKNVRGAFKAVEQIINEKITPQMPEVLELKRNDSLKQTLKDYLQIMNRDLSSINNSVNVIGQSLDLIELKTEKIDFSIFLNNYVSEVNNRSSKFYQISVNLDEELLKEKVLSSVFILGDKEFLRRIFNNIIENAEKHAFEKKINIKNKIRIDVSYNFDDLTIQVDFVNNGKPLPKEFTNEAYKRKGTKLGINSGDGIGGWFINEVMKLHNGSVNVTNETGIGGIAFGDVTAVELTFPFQIK